MLTGRKNFYFSGKKKKLMKGSNHNIGTCTMQTTEPFEPADWLTLQTSLYIRAHVDNKKLSKGACACDVSGSNRVK